MRTPCLLSSLILAGASLCCSISKAPRCWTVQAETTILGVRVDETGQIEAPGETFVPPERIQGDARWTVCEESDGRLTTVP